MPYYSDEQLAEAGRALAESIRNNNARIEGLEAKPAVDRMQQQWNEGRALAKYKGYGPEDLQRLEDLMVQRGIANHADAMKVSPIQPDTTGWLLNRLQPDERQRLMNQDYSGFEHLAINRALNGE
jgi:hypothetical protein